MPSLKSKAYLQKLYDNSIFIVTCSAGGAIFVTFVPIVLVNDYAYPLIVTGMVNHGSYGNCCNLV